MSHAGEEFGLVPLELARFELCEPPPHTYEAGFIHQRPWPYRVERLVCRRVEPMPRVLVTLHTGETFDLDALPLGLVLPTGAQLQIKVIDEHQRQPLGPLVIVMLVRRAEE